MANQSLKDIKVGVLMGGVSSERDISLISGHEAALALKRKGIDVCEIDITTRDKESIKVLLGSHSIDVAFIALHGEFGEDGQIQAILDDLNIPYTGSDPYSSRLAMDKIASKFKFLSINIPTPGFFVLEKNEFDETIKLPKVIKPYYSGSSLGISIVKDKDELKAGIKNALDVNDRILVEDYIEGRELTVGILGEQALGVVEIVPKRQYYDFRAKYEDDQTSFKAPADLEDFIREKVISTALSAHRVLGCRHFSRVDIRLSRDGTPFVLEVNSIPGLTKHSLLPLSAKVKGIAFDGLIIKMVQLAIPSIRKEQQKI